MVGIGALPKKNKCGRRSVGAYPTNSSPSHTVALGRGLYCVGLHWERLPGGGVQHNAQARRSDRMQHSAVQRTLEQHRAARRPSTQSWQRRTKEISTQNS